MKKTVWALAALVLSGTLVRGGETTEEKVARLERKVEQLEQLVRQMQKLLARSSSGTSAAATSSRSAPPPDPRSFRSYWKDGIRMETADRSVRLKAGGRLMNDWEFVDADADLKAAVPGIENGTEFRKARFYLAGRFYDQADFKLQFDFAGGQAVLKDAYLGLSRLPIVGNLRFGHQKEPFGLEELTSSKYTTFMERSLANTLVPGRNTGILLFNSALEQRLAWSFGVFRDAGKFGRAAGNGNFNLTGRVSGLPWNPDSSHLLHLGVAYSHRNPLRDTLRFESRPESHLIPALLDSGSFAATDEERLGLEAALVYGPFSLQSEYTHSSADVPLGPDVDSSGFYVEGSYFLTGEHRPYRRAHGAFGRVHPRRPFLGAERGPGAWEIAARYSFFDPGADATTVGRLEDFTLGLNWYLHPNSRIMWNWVLADPDTLGQASILQMRFQVDF